jgi:hypothetical protein
MVTLIKSHGSPDDETGTVVAADHAEIRSLTVLNTGGDVYANGIVNQGHSGFRVTGVTIHVLGGTSANQGIFNDDGGSGAEMTVRDVSIHLDDETEGGEGIYNLGENAPSEMTLINVSIEGSSPLDANFTGISNSGPASASFSATVTAINVTAVVTSETGYTYGMQNNHAAATSLSNSTLSATSKTYPVRGNALVVGANANPGTVTVDHSKLIGSGLAVDLPNNAAHVVSIGASMVDGGVDTNPGNGTIRCAGCYDGNYENTNTFNDCP